MVWPDNERALSVFQRVGTKWQYPPMGGPPMGLRWETIYPLMDKLDLDGKDWTDLHDDITAMELSALETLREFAPKKDGDK